MHKHKNEPRRESNRAILAHVKKEMDEPRMSESAREEDSRPDHAAGVGKAAILRHGKESHSIPARVDAAEGGE
jgi:hypothetical protein